ncbi:MAG: hypothetical protein PVSMB8_09790 [Vulcanimicrobiaceae bacterium]
MDAASFATAYGLSTSIGLRPFLVLALASVAMQLGFLHPAHTFAYLGTGGATALLASLAALEFAGDKIPVLDHTLHAVHFATKPIAAALLVGSVLPVGTGTPDAATFTLMGLGAFNALGVHAGVTTLRGASTVMSAGFANPVVSVVEDVVALGAALLAIALPYAGAVAAVAVSIVLIVVACRVFAAVRGRAVV